MMITMKVFEDLNARAIGGLPEEARSDHRAHAERMSNRVVTTDGRTSEDGMQPCHALIYTD